MKHKILEILATSALITLESGFVNTPANAGIMDTVSSYSTAAVEKTKKFASDAVGTAALHASYWGLRASLGKEPADAFYYGVTKAKEKSDEIDAREAREKAWKAQNAKHNEEINKLNEQKKEEARQKYQQMTPEERAEHAARAKKALEDAQKRIDEAKAARN